MIFYIYEAYYICCIVYFVVKNPKNSVLKVNFSIFVLDFDYMDKLDSCMIFHLVKRKVKKKIVFWSSNCQMPTIRSHIDTNTSHTLFMYDCSCQITYLLQRLKFM